MLQYRMLPLLLLLYSLPISGNELITAQTHFEKGRYEECQRIAQQIIESHACHTEALSLFGRCAGRSGNLVQAKSYFKQALECDSLYAKAHYGLGTIAYFEGDLNLAEQELTYAVKLGPPNSDFFRNLAGVYVKLEKWVLAKEMCDKGLEIDPNNPGLLGNLSAVYEGLGLYGKAVKTLLMALEKRPANDPENIALGSLYLKTGQYRKALEILDRFEDFPRAIRRKGEALFYSEAYDRALPYLKKSTNVDALGRAMQGPDPKILRLVAEAYYETSQIDSCRLYYRLLRSTVQDEEAIEYITHVLDQLETDSTGEKRIISEVPYYYQGQGATCLKAALLSVLEYWDARVNDVDDFERLDPDYMDDIETLYYLSNRYDEATFYYVSWDLDQLKSAIRAGYPAVVVWGEGNPVPIHSVTAVGYDEVRDVLVVNDPAGEKLEKIPTTEFLRKWRLVRGDVILIVPKSQVHTLDSKLAGKNNDLTGLFKAYGDLQEGRREMGIDGLRRISERQIPFLLQILMVDVYIEIGEFQEAVNVLRKMSDKYGEDPLWWQSLARIANHIGDKEGAIEFANKAIEFANNRYQLANILLAGIYFNDGQLAKARQLYSEAIQTSPNIGVENYLAYYYLGVVQFAQGDVEVALASFRKSAESRAGYTPAWKAIERVSEYQETGYSKQEADAILSELASAK